MVADGAEQLSDAADAVEADPNGGTGEAIASIIANTVRELRESDARTRGATDGQIAQALRQVASTMAQLRREDVAASRSVNANTYAAINRLATKLEDIRDQSQPQTRWAAGVPIALAGVGKRAHGPPQRQEMAFQVRIIPVPCG